VGSININKSVLESIVRRIVPAVPAFDYIIDIYPDKVVITYSDGSTVTLRTVDDLNRWLKGVRGKRIRINNNTILTSNLILTSNEYWIFGEWIEANVCVVEPNISLYLFAPQGHSEDDFLVTNYNPETNRYEDATGLKLFAVFADFDITNPVSGYMPVTIAVLNTHKSYLESITGDIFVMGHSLLIKRCKLRATYIDVYLLSMAYCVAEGASVEIIVRGSAYFYDTTVDLSGAGFVRAVLRSRWVNVPVGAGSIATFPIPIPITSFRNPGFVYAFVEYIGEFNAVPSGYEFDYITPLPEGVTYTIDPDTKRVVVMNNTSRLVLLYVVIKVILWQAW
jgi:hypothetical protein